MTVDPNTEEISPEAVGKVFDNAVNALLVYGKRLNKKLSEGERQRLAIQSEIAKIEESCRHTCQQIDAHFDQLLWAMDRRHSEMRTLATRVSKSKAQKLKKQKEMLQQAAKREKENCELFKNLSETPSCILDLKRGLKTSRKGSEPVLQYAPCVDPCVRYVSAEHQSLPRPEEHDAPSAGNGDGRNETPGAIALIESAGVVLTHESAVFAAELEGLTEGCSPAAVDAEPSFQSTSFPGVASADLTAQHALVPLAVDCARVYTSSPPLPKGMKRTTKHRGAKGKDKKSSVPLSNEAGSQDESTCAQPIVTTTDVASDGMCAEVEVVATDAAIYHSLVDSPNTVAAADLPSMQASKLPDHSLDANVDPEGGEVEPNAGSECHIEIAHVSRRRESSTMSSRSSMEADSNSHQDGTSTSQPASSSGNVPAAAVLESEPASGEDVGVRLGHSSQSDNVSSSDRLSPISSEPVRDKDVVGDAPHLERRASQPTPGKGVEAAPRDPATSANAGRRRASSLGTTQAGTVGTGETGARLSSAAAPTSPDAARGNASHGRRSGRGELEAGSSTPPSRRRSKLTLRSRTQTGERV